MKNKLLITTLLLMTVVFSLSLVSAMEWESPKSYTNHSSAITFIIRYENATEITKPLLGNTTWWYRVDMGAWTNASIITSMTDNCTAITATLAISTLDDDSHYDFNVTIGNVTALNNTGVLLTNITIDDTDPALVIDKGLSPIEPFGAIRLECTGTDNVDSAPTITRTLTKSDDSTVSISTSPYTASGSDVNKLGTFTFNCSIKDYTGNVEEEVIDFRVETEEELPPGEIITRRPKIKTSTILIIIVLVVVIAVVGSLAWLKSKK